MNGQGLPQKLIGVFITIVLLAGCGAPAATPSTTKLSDATATTAQASSPLPETTPAILSDATATTAQASFPLSESGPYFAGNTAYSIVDESRGGRKISLSIWYPALEQLDAQGYKNSLDAPPDLSGAPYPLILTGSNSGGLLFRSHLATYGFVMVTVNSPGFSYTSPWDHSVIDAPLDFLFALDWLTSNPPEILENVLDTNRVGVAGYSSDGLFSLALGGARVNPEYYFSMCAQAPTMDPPIQPFLIEYYCNLSERWDEFSSQVSPRITTVSDGLWQPTTDDRILAVMPMAPDSAWLYGPDGLAAIDIPSLIIAGTADDLVSYKMTSCYVYDHLVNSDTVLISFIGKYHMMVEDQPVISRIDHFAVAFFGYYLQGREEFASYFSEEFVTQFNDLAWGVYEK
jgi:predicted dienelactone hydrolase